VKGFILRVFSWDFFPCLLIAFTNVLFISLMLSNEFLFTLFICVSMLLLSSFSFGFFF
jgi:hypothetical protein